MSVRSGFVHAVSNASTLQYLNKITGYGCLCVHQGMSCGVHSNIARLVAQLSLSTQLHEPIECAHNCAACMYAGQVFPMVNADAGASNAELDRVMCIMVLYSGFLYACVFNNFIIGVRLYQCMKVGHACPLC